jgi:hypothetical protein
MVSDKGYLSQPLAHQFLVTHGVHLITKLRKRMHNRLLELSDKLLLRKRAMIESINDHLKNICQIEHPRHRQPRQLPGQSDLWAHCLLPSAQEAFSRVGTPRTSAGLAYPVLT